MKKEIQEHCKLKNDDIKSDEPERISFYPMFVIV